MRTPLCPDNKRDFYAVKAGVGSDYGIAFVDSKRQSLDGSKTYKLRIPANPVLCISFNSQYSINYFQGKMKDVVFCNAGK